MAASPWAAARIAYEQEVRALATRARALVDAGGTIEAVAREMVVARNAIKAKYRASDDPDVVALMEARNRIKYGDPVGPDADWLFRRYGSWEAVIAAACRPARIAPP